MLNLQKFQNNYNVKIQGVSKMVHEWDIEEGQGNYVMNYSMEHYNGNFDIDKDNIESIGKEILNHINKCNYTDFKETDLTIIDNRITWCQIEDKDCYILETIEEEKRADECYICDYDLFVTINGVQLEEEDLRAILPKAE